MQLALRPYVTTGLAIVGASVIAVAPIQLTPTDIQIPNPVRQSSQAVQLTQNEIEDAFNALILGGTELGLALTVPLTAALIDALGVDTMGLSPDAAATVLLLGLGGTGISGFGSIGTALQDTVDAFGVDFGTGLVALLVGAPSTIIQGFVLGGFGPDLLPLLLDAGVPIPPAIPIAPGVVRPVTDVFAGGLINNPALRLLPGGLQLVPIFGNPMTPTVPTAFNIILPGFFPTVGSLLQGLLDAVDIGGLSTLSAVPDAAQTTSITSVDTPTKGLVTLDVTPDLPDQARGKGGAPDTTLSAPLGDLPGKAADVAAAIGNVTTPGLDLGKTVSTAAKPLSAPGKPTTRNGATDLTDGNFVAPTIPGTNSDRKGGGGSNPLSDTISSAGKNFGDAVSSAVKSVTGGGDK
jgi:hypothetical protein